MIVAWALEVIATALGALFSLLPTFSIDFLTDTSALAADIGGDLVWVNWIFPAKEALDLGHILLAVVFPAVVIYLSAQWIYRHIPHVGGFGPGSG